MHKIVALTLALSSALICAAASAKLPPVSDEAKAKAGETAARAQWSDKVAAYQLCVAMDRTADAYRKSAKSTGKEAPQPIETPPCSNPGPFAASPVTPLAQKPLEASGAHSPPGTASSPPSTKATAAELSGKK